MAISSLSLRRLDRILAEIAAQPTIGLDLLREVTAQLRDMATEMDGTGKTVIAWTLIVSMQSLCDKYDGEPMTVEESVAISEFVQGPVRNALRFLANYVALSDSKTIDLLARLIDQKQFAALSDY